MNGFFSITLILIVATFAFSYKGFKDAGFSYRYKFIVNTVRNQKDYKRLITSGFLHTNWMHLIMNVLGLFFFCTSLEGFMGPIRFILIYFVSLVGGNILSTYIHRFQGSYSSVGASGAIFGSIFASIAVIPGMSITLFPLPIAIPGWIFGLAYVIFSIYGIKSKKGNIGHDAHLGGGITGLLLGVVMYPTSLIDNTFSIIIVAAPAIAFITLLVYKPEYLLVDSPFKKNKFLTVEDKYNLSKIDEAKEVDRILEKIHRRGINSLSRKERTFLEAHTK
ncbi:MAG: rhomboid family intrarane serine protease [Segetibacter sp.]|nr:rhomboid family intrarane serine protease [Segetibacter sp.]